MSSAAYLWGRDPASLDPASDGEDALFAAQRMDAKKFVGREFKHCTFANVSFLDCEIRDARFIDCVFANCYFRHCKIQDSRFSACRFIDCDLTKIDIRTSDLKYYNNFQGCYIPFGELEQSLPSEGNLKQHLCLNLAEEASRKGALKDAGLYRQAGAEGREDHLKSAFLRSSTYYRDKYKGAARLTALVEYMGSRLRGWAWGYRRSFLTILRNWALVTLVLFPLIFWPLKGGLRQSGKAVGAGDLWVASIGNMLPGSGISGVNFVSTGARILAFSEVLIGLLFAGLAASLLFRAVFDRWR
jgi:Pentapeptide repeats (9 copies)